MKNIKRLIIILALIIIIIITILIVLYNVNKKPDYGKGEVAKDGKITDEVEDVSDPDVKIQKVEYFLINNAVNAYFQRLNLENSSYYNQDGSGISDDEKKKILIDILSDSYVKNNNISTSNLGNIKMVKGQMFFVPLQMKKFHDGNVKTYLVKGISETINYKFVYDVCLIVNIDFFNNTFSIEPVDSEYENITGAVELQTIQKNEYNMMTKAITTVENITRDYINIYKRLALGRPDIAYEKMDKEYREKRFGTLDDFKKYVSDNQTEIMQINMTKLLGKENDGFVQYVGKDKYNNLYIFNEKSLLDYTIELDDYTLDYKDKNFLKKYKGSDAQYKMAYNIEKWVKMINNRDYKNAYSVLDDGFKAQNFKTEEDFINHMKEFYPLRYKVEYGETTEEDKGIYKQIIYLSDITGENKDKIFQNIVMKFEGNTNFRMSFRFRHK